MGGGGPGGGGNSMGREGQYGEVQVGGHLKFPSGHPPQYYPGPKMINFGDQGFVRSYLPRQVDWGSWTSIRPLYIRSCCGAGGGTKFGSILPISLQKIEYEKIHAVQSNKLAKRYTMKPITIYIDKYLGGDIAKLVIFSLLVYFTVCLTAFCVNALNSPYRQFYPLTLSKRT